MPWFSGGFSLSKTWNVARLTSEISSSVRISRRALSCDGTFVAGAVADAAPVIARETPAAPNAKAAFLRFRMELRLACVMVDPPRQRFDQGTRTNFSALRHEPARCRFGSAWPNERRKWAVLASGRGRTRPSSSGGTVSHTVFRNFTFYGYGLRQRRPGMTPDATSAVPAHRAPDQLASGDRLFVARPSALSALHGAGEQHRVARLSGRLADLAVRYVPTDHRSVQSQRLRLGGARRRGAQSVPTVDRAGDAGARRGGLRHRVAQRRSRRPRRGLSHFESGTSRARSRMTPSAETPAQNQTACQLAKLSLMAM